MGVAVSKQMAPRRRWRAAGRPPSSIGPSRAVDRIGGQRIGPGVLNNLDHVGVVHGQDRLASVFSGSFEPETTVIAKRRFDGARPVRRFPTGNLQSRSELDQPGMGKVRIGVDDRYGR